MHNHVNFKSARKTQATLTDNEGETAAIGALEVHRRRAYE